jgi:hypothetical protein
MAQRSDLIIKHQPKHLARINAMALNLRDSFQGEFIRKARAELESGNRRDRLAGVDRHGRPLAPVTSKRRGVYEGSDAPALVPRRTNSTAIRGFRTSGEVKSASRGRTQVTVIRAWIEGGLAFIFPFHRDGIGKARVKRDILGVTPRVVDRIHKLFREIVRGA